MRFAGKRAVVGQECGELHLREYTKAGESTLEAVEELGFVSGQQRFAPDTCKPGPAISDKQDRCQRQRGKIVVEIKGVDVYHPTTGQIRSASTDYRACWLIDTDYNGENFSVRHAYFTGSDESDEKLKRALRADIDEAAWSSLYSTVSRPFDRPESGKIAVKVIHHYGDEVLKVFEIGHPPETFPTISVILYVTRRSQFGPRVKSFRIRAMRRNATGCEQNRSSEIWTCFLRRTTYSAFSRLTGVVRRASTRSEC